MFATIKKALAGGVAGGLAALAQAFADGGVTPAEWTVVVGAVVGGFALVWLAPKNADSSATPNRARDY